MKKFQREYYPNIGSIMPFLYVEEITLPFRQTH